MFESFRDKILNVQHDLSTSFRNLSTGDTTPKNRKPIYQGISKNAGANILNYYQQQWKELHENDATSAKAAEEADLLLGNLHTFCSAHLNTAKTLNNHLAALPQLQTGILELMGKIGELEGVFEEVEDALTNLEDVIEVQELQERMLDHRFQLAMYKEKKLADFEDMKTKLGRQHASKVLEYERKQDAILRERQLTFQEVFEEDLQEYRKHGIKELRKRVSSTGSSSSVPLEDIDLEDDASALNDFLGEDVNDNTRSTQESDTIITSSTESEPTSEKNRSTLK